MGDGPEYMVGGVSIGEVERLVVGENHLTFHCSDDDHRMSKRNCRPEILVNDMHRHGVPVEYVD